jgi:hypothetical protein
VSLGHLFKRSQQVLLCFTVVGKLNKSTHKKYQQTKGKKERRKKKEERKKNKHAEEELCWPWHATKAHFPSPEEAQQEPSLLCPCSQVFLPHQQPPSPPAFLSDGSATAMRTPKHHQALTCTKLKNNSSLSDVVLSRSSLVAMAATPAASFSARRRTASSLVSALQSLSSSSTTTVAAAEEEEALGLLEERLLGLALVLDTSVGVWTVSAAC